LDGKLDLHYTAEGLYGTLLLWGEELQQLRASQRRAFVRALLDEVSQPWVCPTNMLWNFAPTLDAYEVFHNVAIDENGQAETAVAE
jgi:hypothetical protein